MYIMERKLFGNNNPIYSLNAEWFKQYYYNFNKTLIVRHERFLIKAKHK